MATGGACFVASGALLGASSPIANDLAIAGSPGPTGFPAGRWSDIEDDYARVGRLTQAARVTAALGAGFVVVGAVLLVAGTVQRRRFRRSTMALGPGGPSLRW